MNHQLHKAYQQASHTVAKTRQVVMLYDGAIRFMNQAKDAIDAGQIEERYNKLTRVCEIIAGLQSCLDFNAGQDTAKLLYTFYSSVESRVFNLHHVPDKQVCEQIIKDLKEMRDVWDIIDRGKDGVKGPVAPTPPDRSAPLDPVTVSA